MATDSNARVPQLNRDVTELAQTIQGLALLVGMRFVINDKKIKAFNASASAGQAERTRSEPTSRIAATD
jgi:hypothetical protein